MLWPVAVATSEKDLIKYCRVGSVGGALSTLVIL